MKINEPFTLFTEIDSLLETLKSLSAHDEEVEELNILEGMLKSNTFKKAKQVHTMLHKAGLLNVLTTLYVVTPIN